MANQFLSDIPIIVETPSRPIFPMVRCYYIAIEFDTPDNQWTIGLGDERLPFLMLGLTGTVQAPVGALRFNQPQLIDRLFRLIEGSGGLVNFEDIWLPARLFAAGTEMGTVYRIEIGLFRTAFAFRDSRVTRETLEERTGELHEQIRFSADETKAFRAWSAETIALAERREPKNPELRLWPKREQ
jgi:hypothetical protein